MTEERDEKELTGDLAIDDESAKEVTGGREHREASGHASLSSFLAPERMRRLRRRLRKHG